jgi:2-keto-4-pentenoate hydratase/2-oxohepta-3-ene-1,7-dioic acid hydratase in catechol pathway
MKLMTIIDHDRQTPAAAIGDDILVFAAATILPDAAEVPASMLGILEAGQGGLDQLKRLIGRVTDGPEAIRRQLRETNALRPRATVRTAAPVPRPGMIVAGSMNFRAHLAEMKDTPVPSEPTAFLKSPHAVVGSGDRIVLPPAAPGMVDFEGEFCCVIGRECHDVPLDRVMDHIAGYTLINDISARDWVSPIFSSTGIMGPIMAWERNIMGKQFPTFCPMGPALVTRDEIPDPATLRIETRVNGAIMQSAPLSDLIFGIDQLIHHFARRYRLMPGDLVTVGSPSGVGFGRNPQLFLKDGDCVEVAVDEIGVLRNLVASPSPGKN